MATKIGGKRMTVALEENGAVVFRVDGVIVTGDPPAVKDGSITRSISGYGAKYTFEWPDGTIVTAGQVSHFALNVGVKPSPPAKARSKVCSGTTTGRRAMTTWIQRRSRASGSCPRQRRCSTTPPASRPRRSSIRPFPIRRRRCRIARPPKRHVAKKASRMRRSSTTVSIDFGITNGFLFADQYAQQQAVLRAGFATMTAATPPVPAMRVSSWLGAITDFAHPPQVTFDAAAGDVVDIAQARLQRRRSPTAKCSLWWSIPTARTSRRDFGCDIGRVDLPVAGTYTVKASARPPKGDGLGRADSVRAP